METTAIARPTKPFSKLEYCQYLLSSQINYTLTNYAEHMRNVSHDLVKLYLERERLTASDIWKEVKTDLNVSLDGYIVFDDTVLDKSYSKKMVC